MREPIFLTITANVSLLCADSEPHFSVEVWVETDEHRCEDDDDSLLQINKLKSRGRKEFTCLEPYRLDEMAAREPYIELKMSSLVASLHCRPIARVSSFVTLRNALKSKIREMKSLMDINFSKLSAEMKVYEPEIK